MLLEEKYGLRRNRSCMNEVFTFIQIFEKRKEFNLETYIYLYRLQRPYEQGNVEDFPTPHLGISVFISTYKDTHRHTQNQRG